MIHTALYHSEFITGLFFRIVPFHLSARYVVSCVTVTALPTPIPLLFCLLSQCATFILVVVDVIRNRQVLCLQPGWETESLLPFLAEGNMVCLNNNNDNKSSNDILLQLCHEAV